MPKKTLFTDNISSLFGGVSTQAEPLRFNNQCAEQVNFLGSVSRGLERRNGTKWVSQLEFSNASDSSLVTAIDKAGDEDFITIFTGDSNNPIEIYSLDGTKQNIIYEADSKPYVTTNTPRESLRTALIADYSVVSNKEVQVKMTSKLSSSYDKNSALVWVKLGQPKTSYTLTIDGIDLTATLGDTGTNTGGIIDTWLADASWPEGWIGNKISEGVLEVYKDSGQPITEVSVTDNYGDTAIEYINAVVEKDTDLPPAAPDGYIVKVSGVDGDESTDWYVKFSTTTRTWKETVKPDAEVELDASTMPHFLIRTGITNGVYDFVFCSAGYDYGTGVANTYDERAVGDDESNALPSFVEDYIIDLSFFRNRLAFLSTNSVVLSRANDFFNFFSASALDSFADDNIDVKLGSNIVVSPQFLGEFKEALVVFTENEQFSINSSDDPLEPSTVRSDKIGSYTANGKCLPLTLGANMYFTDNLEGYSAVREYFIQGDTVSQSTIDISEHVEGYLPKDAKYLSGIINKQLFLMAVEGEQSNLYLYRSYSQGNEKVQSAWCKLQFPYDVVGTEVFNDTVYIVTKEEDQVHLEVLNLFDYTDPFQIEREVPTTWDFSLTVGETGRGTILTLPYNIDDNEVCQIVADGNRLLQGVKVDTNKVYVGANLNGKVLKVGIVIPASYQLSRYYMKDRDGVGITSGHLNLRSLDVTYEDTASFLLDIEPVGRDAYTKIFSSTNVGEDQVGILSLESDTKKFGINGNTKTTRLTLRNDSIFRSRIVAFGIEGAYRNRGQLR